MSNDTIEKLTALVIAKHGLKATELALQRILHAPLEAESTLTIIANAGLHPLPQEVLRGDVFEASRGNLNLTDASTLHLEYVRILSGVARKLLSKTWAIVYLIPTGPPTLALQVKLLVYQICRLATVDLFYSKGQFIEVSLDHRELIGESAKSSEG